MNRKEWTREERYRELHSAQEIQPLYDRIQTSAYRQTYHVQPVTGLSSDPNGFAWHAGRWFLCYQWCPWGAVHGLKYWYQVGSEDLISWKNEGVALWPDRDFDNRGTHSGSAISVDGQLYFFYTGNHRDEDWLRTPYTCAGVLHAGQTHPEKLPEPLFGPRAEYSEHQRDPKVVYDRQSTCYYLLIGAQDAQKRGCVLVYRSKVLLEGWSFAGQLQVPGYEDFGGMWECPTLMHIDDRDVLIFSPQYTTLPGRGKNTNHNVYIIGRMDYEKLVFTPEGSYHFLDYGFDFYAAQGASTPDAFPPVLIAWIGLPDNHYPTEEEDWEGSMTLPRQLHVRDGLLLQAPVAGIEQLRQERVSPEADLPRACEILLQSDGEDLRVAVCARADGSGGLVIDYDAKKQVCRIDRRGMDRRFNTHLDECLEMPLPRALTKMRLFIDHSSVEIFTGDGEAVFTTHLYPRARECRLCIQGQAHAEIWSLRRSVEDNFVI